MSLNYQATRFQCTWPWEMLVMLCDGRIVCGCADPYAKRVLGDARTTTIEGIWNGSTITQLRRDMNAAGSTFCGDCALKRPLAVDEAPVERDLDAGRHPSRMFIECTAACNISCFEACCAPETGITRTRQAGMLDFDLFRRVIEQRPRDAAAHHQLGALLLDMDEGEEAEKELRAALAIDPNQRAATFALGNFLVRAGRKDEGKALLARFQELSARDEGMEVERNRLLVEEGAVGARLKLATEHLAAGELEKAERVAREATTVAGESAPAHAMLATVLLARGDAKGARAEAERAGALAPGEPGALKVMARVLLAEGKSAEAEATLRPLSQVGSRDPEVWLTLASAQGAQAHYEESAASCRRALEIVPRMPAALLGLGLSLEKGGQPTEARKALEELLAVDPGNAAAREALGRLSGGS